MGIKHTCGRSETVQCLLVYATCVCVCVCVCVCMCVCACTTHPDVGLPVQDGQEAFQEVCNEDWLVVGSRVKCHKGHSPHTLRRKGRTHLDKLKSTHPKWNNTQTTDHKSKQMHIYSTYRNSIQKRKSTHKTESAY